VENDNWEINGRMRDIEHVVVDGGEGVMLMMAREIDCEMVEWCVIIGGIGMWPLNGE